MKVDLVGDGQRLTAIAGRFSMLNVHSFAQRRPGGDTRSAAAKAERADWVAGVRSFEEALDLYKHATGSLVDGWQYLLAKISERISTLSALTRAAAVSAIDSGKGTIDRKLVKAIPDDYIAALAQGRQMQKPPHS